MKEKTLNINLFLNSVRIGLSILFPLITFPYVTRILLPSQIGEYNYANSLINYFMLIAGLALIHMQYAVAAVCVRRRMNLKNLPMKYFQSIFCPQ